MRAETKAPAFTPGPWAVHEHVHVDGEFWCSIGQATGFGPITDIVGAEGNHTEFFKPVSGMDHLVTPVEEQRRNAHLIAAAPEMYAALKNCIGPLECAAEYAMTDIGEMAYKDALAGVHAAIAKAEGRAR